MTEFSIQFSKDINRKPKIYESIPLQVIHQCCNKNDLTVREKNKLIDLQTKLDKFYIN